MDSRLRADCNHIRQHGRFFEALPLAKEADCSVLLLLSGSVSVSVVRIKTVRRRALSYGRPHDAASTCRRRRKTVARPALKDLLAQLSRCLLLLLDILQRLQLGRRKH